MVLHRPVTDSPKRSGRRHLENYIQQFIVVSGRFFVLRQISGTKKPAFAGLLFHSEHGAEGETRKIISDVYLIYVFYPV